ncbi:MAG: hypothetical protein A3F74_26840 [Betaproteobacteria bacterium RIFCSPLOWO2_12_FULL_62_58]|nr:MAG: hypothetical protein A3F74_26840 [Betaproteobacteria bacterium RIFCSPLOWO2_12_FULL_62_58]
MNTICRYAALALFAMLVPAAGAAPGEVRIYEPGQLTRDRYEIVTRLWVESWRSAVQIPGHADQPAAIAGLKSEAARLGANALTNVACLVDDGALWGRGPHFCYALAIRLKK